MSNEGLKVFKFVGAGNDFLFVNLFDNEVRSQLRRLEKTLSRSELAKKLCRRQEAVGADGLIYIQKAKGVDFAWEFYNSDGSHADMCGNAARCAIRFFKDVLKQKKTKVKFETAVGVLNGDLISRGMARVFLPAPKLVHEGLTVRVGSRTVTGTFLSTGVPHFVVETKLKNFSGMDAALAQAIQVHKIFGPAQTNVTLFEVIKKGKIRAVTFERGVRAFTKACGTGAIAAAYVVSDRMHIQEQVMVEMPGGSLGVSFDNSGTACLEGEASYLGEFRVNKECFYGHI